MQQITFGTIVYTRPQQPVGVDEIRQFLAISGKEVAKLAFSSLEPDSDGELIEDSVAEWMRNALCLKSADDGRTAVRILAAMGLLWMREPNGYRYFRLPGTLDPTR